MENSVAATDMNSGRVRDAVSRAFVSSGVAIDTSGLSIIEVGAGELLCDVDDPATTAWIVVSGRMRATTVGEDGGETTLGIDGPGDLIGESALLEEGRRRARVRALRRSRLVVLDRAWFYDLLSSHPEAAMAVVRTVVERTERNAAPSAAIVAIVPLDSTVVDEARLIGEAAAACSGQTLVRAADTANEDFGETAHGFERLDEIEQEHGGQYFSETQPLLSGPLPPPKQPTVLSLS